MISFNRLESFFESLSVSRANFVLRTQIASSGFQVLIPYCYTYKTALNGTSQTVSLRFNRGHGIKLKKIYHSIFNSTEQANTAYDCSNLAGAKTQVFYTMLDNNRIQEYNLTVANGDDYIYLKNLEKSY